MLIPILVLSGLGATAALGLGLAARKFHVERDPRLERLFRLMPGVNCGACGQAGCNAFAETLIHGDAHINDCPISDENDKKAQADILGTEFSGGVRMVATVLCIGTPDLAKNRFNYQGARTCRSAHDIQGGAKICAHGCLGYGDCAIVCPYDAIDLQSGVARIIEDKCTACRICFDVCPPGIIKLKPVDQPVIVLCSSLDKAKDTHKSCEVGCIGCKKCAKVCPKDAIVVENFLAVIDPEKCDHCGDCVSACPTDSIIDARQEDGRVVSRVQPPSDPDEAARKRSEFESHDKRVSP